MLNPKELLNKVQETTLFVQWQEKHQKSFLSHFFCDLKSNLTMKSNWEIGFYNPEISKITTFVDNQGKFFLKPEDDVFKKDQTDVEELKLDQIKLSANEATEIFKKNAPELFPSESYGDGFLVLQELRKEALWSFSFITKSLKFINLKINAKTGKVKSHDTVEVVQQS